MQELAAKLTDCAPSETCLPVLQLYRRKVSSSDAVSSWSPLSSNEMPVICRGSGCGLLEPGEMGGVGSMASLNILAGFSLDC